MDYQGIPDDILDEIALEGLEGITITCKFNVVTLIIIILKLNK